jgi:hypothetical protein
MLEGVAIYAQLLQSGLNLLEYVQGEEVYPRE